MSKQMQRAAWMALMLAASVGCGSSSSSSDAGTDMDDLANMLDQPKATAPDKAAAAKTPAAKPAEPTPPEPRYTEARKVTKYDPKRGRVFHNQPGYLNVLFSARFLMENQLTFDKVKHATDLYEATNGYKPRSHEEFMSEIIDANYIELPPLVDDYEYWYDGQDGVLKMRKPIAENDE